METGHRITNDVGPYQIRIGISLRMKKPVNGISSRIVSDLKDLPDFFVQPSFVAGDAFLSACLELGLYVICPVPVREAYPVCDRKHGFGVWYDADFIARVKKQTEIEYKRTSLFSNVLGYVFMQEGDFPAFKAATEVLNELGAPLVIGASGSICGLVYPSVDKLTEKVSEGMGRDILYLTEYAPSFGVGCPDASRYEDVISSSPCCVGGAMARFVDEFLDGEGGRDDGLFTVDRRPTTGAENVQFLYRKIKTADEMARDEKVISRVLSDEENKEYIINGYIERIRENSSFKSLPKGGAIPVAPVYRPRSIREAGEIAKKILERI